MDPAPQSPDEQLAQSAWVRRLAQSMLRDPGLAEDAAQESAIAAWRHGPIDASSRAGWLATTVRRFAGRLVRGEARRSTRERAVARSEALPSAAELVERAEAHRALVAAVLALDEPYRSTVLLRYVEDLPPRAIARRAGIPVATVKTRLARGLENLRRELESKHGDAREWLGLVVPLFPVAHVPPLVLGASLVKTIKLTAAALLVLLLTTGLIFVLRPRAESAVAESPPAPGEAAPVPEAVAGVGRADAPGERQGLDAQMRAATAPDPAAVPESEPLRGRVLDLAEKPIAGARIRFLHSRSYGYRNQDAAMEEPEREIAATESSPDGRFSTDLPYGMLVGLQVSAAGFADEHLESRFGGGAEVVVHLGAGAALTGLVTRAQDGLPLGGATVRVGAGIDDGIVRVVLTDASGRYRCEGLPPGTVGLIVAPDQEAMTRWEEMVLAPGQTLQHDVQVGPGERVRGRVLDQRTGAPIEGAEVSAWSFIYKTVRSDAHGEFELGGAPGRQIQLSARAAGYGRTDLRVLDTHEEVELRLAAGHRASGRVLAPGGAPLADVFVAATGYDGSSGVARPDVRTSATGADGRFELTDLRADLPHALVVRTSGFGVRFLPFPAVEPEAAEFGDIVLEPAAGLEGRVLDAGGTPRAGVSVVLRPATVDPACQTSADLHGRRSVDSDAIGRFVLRDLAAGEWIVKLQGPDLPPLPEQSLRLASGEFRRGFDVRLGEELSIEGSVGDGQGHALAGAWVSALPEDGSRGGGTRASDADGRFRIPGLKPGAYTLKVLGPRSDTEPIARFEELRQRHVAAGTRGLELRLIARSSSIRGRVLDADGKPLAGAFVFRIDVGFPPEEFVLSDSEGRFELPAAPGDGLQLFVQRGIPLAQAVRTPTYAEFRAGRVVDDDVSARVLSAGIRAGSTDVELRLKAPR